MRNWHFCVTLQNQLLHVGALNANSKILTKDNSQAGTDYWNSKLFTNIQCKKNNRSAFLIKGLSSCILVNLKKFGENCLNFNWKSSRAAPRISYFRVPTKNEEYRIDWRINIVAVLTHGDEDNLKRQKTIDLHYPHKNMTW